MPQFTTGNAIWDNGLNSFGGGISSVFDPSRAAQAGYYGAEMRNAQMGTAQKANQIANLQTAINMAEDPSGSYTPPGVAPAPGMINGPMITQSPGAATASPMFGPNGPPPSAPPVGNATPPPVAAPPTLGQTVAPGAVGTTPPPAAATPPAPPQAPPAAAPPAPAPASPPPATTAGGSRPPPAMPPLSTTVSGAPAGPPGAPTTQPPLPPPGQIVNAVAAVAAGGAPALTTGTPPPTSSPAPTSGAPSAPNTTGSDGTVSSGDPVSGVFHSGSITAPGGGIKTTGPANPNGSPARPMPQFTLAAFTARAIAGGMDAQQANLEGRAIIESLYDKGIIDEGTYHHMMGTMEPSIINTDTGARTAITTTGMNNQTQIATTGMQTQAQRDVANITQQGETSRAPPVFVADPNNASTGRFLPPNQFQQPGGVPAYNPNAVSSAVAPVTTQPGGPGTPTFSATTQSAQVSKTPLYQPTQETPAIATGNYIDPKNPTQLLPRTFQQAQQQGLVAAPTTSDGWNALAQSAAANAPTPEARQAIIDRVMAMAPVGAKPVDAVETLRNSNINDRQLQQAMPVPVGSFGSNFRTNTNPAGSSPELGITLDNLTNEYFARSPDMTVRGNRIASANAAIQQLIRQGYINPNQSRTLGISGTTSINKSVVHKDGSITQDPHFRADILDLTTKKAVPPGQAPVVHMAAPSTVGTVMANAAGAAGQTPGGVAGGGTPAAIPSRPAGPRIGRAPPGATPGQPAWVLGQPGTVGMDGYVHAAG